MPRTVPEWIGSSPDSPVPPRVRLRVLQKYNRCCAKCTCKIIGKLWTCDHVIALINGGENREKNLQPLCSWCCPQKDASDVHAKAETYRKARKHVGIKIPHGRPLLGTVASGWKRYLNGFWERR